MKICRICKEEKLKFASKFICTDCKYERYKEKHPKSIKENSIRQKNRIEKMKVDNPEEYQKYLEVNRQKCREWDHRTRAELKEKDMLEHPEKYIVLTDEEKRIKKNEYAKQYREEHKQKIKDELKIWRDNNKEYRKEKQREYNILNKDKVRLRKTKYQKERLQKDPQAKLKALLRTRINAGFRLYSKNGKTTSCAEYGIDFKAIFDKVGPRPSDDCHLDHIIPMSLFNFDIKEHVQLCNCPENLRWVHWEENLEKADKIIETIILNEPKLIEICEILNIKFSDKYS